MGTDIHAYLEYQPHPGLPEWGWDCLARDVHIWRDYGLFAILANVRNDATAGWERGAHPLPFIARPRGIPPGISAQVKEVIEWRGGHSHSYLSYEELVRAQEIYSQIEGNTGEPEWVPKGTPLSEHCLVYEETELEDAAARFRMFPPRPLSHPGPMVLAYCPRTGKRGPNLDLAAILAYLQVFHEQDIPTRMVFFFDS
jgi:hypothetical protein